MEDSYWDGEIPWVSGADLSSSGLFIFDSTKRITQLGVDNSSTKILPVGTVMITARGTVGSTKITAVPMAMSQTSFGFKSKENYSDAFVYVCSRETIRQLKTYAYGAVFDTFTQSTLDITSIAIPPQAIIDAFCEIIDPIFELIKVRHSEENLRSTYE
jgi:type I restriction enzyme S subunit